MAKDYKNISDKIPVLLLPKVALFSNEQLLFDKKDRT